MTCHKVDATAFALYVNLMRPYIGQLNPLPQWLTIIAQRRRISKIGEDQACHEYISLGEEGSTFKPCLLQHYAAEPKESSCPRFSVATYSLV